MRNFYQENGMCEENLKKKIFDSVYQRVVLNFPVNIPGFYLARKMREKNRKNMEELS